MTRPSPTDLLNPGQYSVFTAFLEPGDEAILFEPFFDQYLPSVTFNGGIPVYVPLHPRTVGIDKPTGHDWKIDFNELRLASPSASADFELRCRFQTRSYAKNKNDCAEHSTQPCGQGVHQRRDRSHCRYRKGV